VKELESDLRDLETSVDRLHDQLYHVMSTVKGLERVTKGLSIIAIIAITIVVTHLIK